MTRRGAAGPVAKDGRSLPRVERGVRTTGGVLSSLALAGCAGDMRMLDPAGVQAERIAHLIGVIFVVSLAVFAIVLAATALAVRRGRRRRVSGELADDSPAAEHRHGRAMVWAVGVSFAVLFVYLVAAVRTGGALALLTKPAPRFDQTLTIEVTGHRWWWEFRYQDPVAAHQLTTANELHIPVGRPVRIIGRSADVIHSFWIPNLHGKRDLIPGYTQTGWLRADRVGVWSGQCAEFCGAQHAHMRMTVVTEPPAAFNAWYLAQLAPAAPPSDSSAQLGERIFLSHSCVMCHAVDGNPAGSNVGPNLTHLASRRTIAAGTLLNTRGNLAGWIVDPQRIKPGSLMPPQALTGDELNALLDYMRSLR